MQHTYSAEQVKHIINSTGILMSPSNVVQWLLIDSRKIIEPLNSIFFALPGKQNSHQYIEELFEKGVRNFVVSDEKYVSSLADKCNVFLVDNTLNALQTLVAFHRTHFQYPVIGITGSNGKTIVKDWLYQTISPEYTIVRSPKSYNSQIGVPLSVWNMNQAHQLGIFEAGISTVNEMQNLEKIIQPNIGILTNIKSAHDEGFKSSNEKTLEKLKLFEHAEIIIYSPDYVDDGLLMNRKVFTWSFNNTADVQVLKVERSLSNAHLLLYYQNREHNIEVPFTDDASIENCVICICTLLYLGYKMDTIQERIRLLQSIPMRLEMKQGIHHCSIVNDSYSADLTSLYIAVDFLIQQKHSKKTVIISDIVHAENEDVYTHLASFLKTKKIDRVIGIGNEITKAADAFSMEKVFYPSTDAFVNDLHNLNFFDEGILIKGGRKFEFERIVHLLEEKVHETVLEVNLNAIVHNLNFYRSKLYPGTKVMAMVKAFAYGSGSFEIASILQYNKVDYLAVAYADEGVELRKAGITLPIMVMSPEPASFQKLIEFSLEPEIYNTRILNSFIKELTSKNIEAYPIHLKFDTGMHRLGFETAQLDELIKQISNNKYIKVVSVFSHLAASENSNFDDFTQSQFNLFDAMYGKLRLHTQSDYIRHISNTAAILRFPEAQYEMVRLGIGLYGIENVGQYRHELQRVGTLKTTVTQVRNVKAGDSIGYGRKAIMKTDAEIATIKIGYADGYSRAFGNGNAYVCIGNHKPYIVGSVCMDMCMIDVTGMGVCEGDEVIVFGDDPSIESLAEIANTIPYEILTSISQRVQRIYYYE